MKRLKFILFLALLAIPFLQSCNSKIDQPSQYALVTIRTGSMPGSSFYGVLDNNEKIYAGDVSLISNYVPKDGQRALIYFTPLETTIDGFKYNAKVYGIEHILTKNIVEFNDIEKGDTLGTDNIAINRAWLGGGFLNVEFSVRSAMGTKHSINLANVDKSIEILETKPGYITLDFRHNSKGVNEGELLRGSVCFNLAQYNPIMSGAQGLYIRHKPYNSDTHEYLTVKIEGETSPE